ncbi:hypothetical protein HOE67_05170 [Candidatus Peregrinibacteria bacterium]|jgi:hypothetical protein|nr:hypothetical protein [Candidatus Peregrinibacteria bacterium]MBT4056473.1 hypothetical protein [Candidatus Peregrinibacteria bacterium]
MTRLEEIEHQSPAVDALKEAFIETSFCNHFEGPNKALYEKAYANLSRIDFSEYWAKLFKETLLYTPTRYSISDIARPAFRLEGSELLKAVAAELAKPYSHEIMNCGINLPELSAMNMGEADQMPEVARFLAARRSELGGSHSHYGKKRGVSEDWVKYVALMSEKGLIDDRHLLGALNWVWSNGYWVFSPCSANYPEGEQPYRSLAKIMADYFPEIVISHLIEHPN